MKPHKENLHGREVLVASTGDIITSSARVGDFIRYYNEFGQIVDEEYLQKEKEEQP